MVFVYQGCCTLSNSLDSSIHEVAHTISYGNTTISSKSERKLCEGAFVDSVDHKERKMDISSSNGRVMLIDGTSIIYRAYYKLLGMNIAHPFDSCLSILLLW